MTIGELIREYRRMKGMTQEELASKLDCSKAYICAVESGSKTISVNQAKKFAKALGIPPAELQDRLKLAIKEPVGSKEAYEELLRAKENLDKFLENFGYHMSTDRVLMLPVLGKIPAGVPLATFDDLREITDEFFPVPSNEVKNEHCFFLKVSGDSMVDIGILEGDLVLVDPEDNEIYGVGRVMAVEVSGEVTLKTVVRLDDTTIRLLPENKRYGPIEIDMRKKHVRIIGAALPFMARRNPHLTRKG